ncbi:plastocyanin [Nocardia transvalensis]|uniref:Plastocyanin n=2 Tax=Nocardia transvalensis TaxID=37333 RepID=A0A7W9UFK0_9NOCA|nr:cupredoxin family copper-binding protein [Nocardia transvalensis]MBB5911192.1 plastocyanin [Nocardia transvalensis]
MRRFPGYRAAAAVAAALTVLTMSACGGGTPSAPSDSAPTPVFGSGTVGMAPDGAPPMTTMPGMAAPQGPAPAGPNAVSIDNFAFAPQTLTVRAGTTVTWTNHDEEPHTVAAQDGAFHSPGMGAGATYTFTFTKAGTYHYLCSIHPFMRADVVVTP